MWWESTCVAYLSSCRDVQRERQLQIDYETQLDKKNELETASVKFLSRFLRGFEYQILLGNIHIYRIFSIKRRSIYLKLDLVQPASIQRTRRLFEAQRFLKS